MTNRFGPWLLALALVVGGCSGGGDEPGYEGDLPGECSDGADNDRDGLYDCGDPDCAASPACTGADADADADGPADAPGEEEGEPGADADADPEADSEAEVGPTACDPVTQAPCDDGSRCAWVASDPDPGEARCVPEGTVELGGTCTSDPAGDDCRRGLQCLGGTCRTICALAPDSCAAGHTCVRYGGVFDDPDTGEATAGLCDPSCDPLTQTRATDGAAHCGGPLDDLGHPTLGCYGTPNGAFVCAPAGDPARTADVPAADPGAPVYLNSCAPGFLPLLRDPVDAGTVLCTALCRPGDTFLGNPANAPGLAGSGATCPDAGTGEVHECRYWWFLEDPTLPTTPLSNALGFCIDYPGYSYDSDGDGLPDSTFPSCTTLSPTTETYEPGTPDYLYWGCGAL